jgi:hypothetical protein
MPRDPSTRATGLTVGLHKRSKRALAGSPNPSPPRWRACAVAPILAKLAKHLALLASVLIIGGALGKSFSGQIALFIVIVAASLVHSIARTLQRRPPAANASHRGPS